MDQLLKMLDGNLIVVQIICFIILMTLLKAFLWKPVLGMLDARKKKVADDLKAIEDTRSEVEILRQDYEKHIARISDEAQEHYRQALKEADGKAREIQIQAEKDAQHIIEDARSEVTFELSKARESFKGDMVEVIIKVTEQMIQEKLSVEDDQKIVEDMIQDLSKTGAK